MLTWHVNVAFHPNSTRNPVRNNRTLSPLLPQQTKNTAPSFSTTSALLPLSQTHKNPLNPFRHTHFRALEPKTPGVGVSANSPSPNVLILRPRIWRSHAEYRRTRAGVTLSPPRVCPAAECVILFGRVVRLPRNTLVRFRKSQHRGCQLNEGFLQL